jgi:hypothetical protein
VSDMHFKIPTDWAATGGPEQRERIAFSALVLVALLLRPAFKPLLVGAMAIHTAVLTVILLALYRWRTAAMTTPGLALSVLWCAWVCSALVFG